MQIVDGQTFNEECVLFKNDFQAQYSATVISREAVVLEIKKPHLQKRMA